MFLIRVRMHVQYPGRARGLCLQGIFVMVKEGDTAVIDTKNILLNLFFSQFLDLRNSFIFYSMAFYTSSFENI